MKPVFKPELSLSSVDWSDNRNQSRCISCVSHSWALMGQTTTNHMYRRTHKRNRRKVRWELWMTKSYVSIHLLVFKVPQDCALLIKKKKNCNVSLLISLSANFFTTVKRHTLSLSLSADDSGRHNTPFIQDACRKPPPSRVVPLLKTAFSSG